MRVLVTRPSEDAADTAALLQSRGHEAVIAPLLTVNFRDGPPIDLSGVQAILATSANGVRALSRRTPQRDLPLFAVGPKTAEVARTAGFAPIRNANGDAADLARAVPRWLSPEHGTLLHASSNEGEGPLASTLRAMGFTVRTEVLYDVGSVVELPVAAREALQGGALDAVLLFSPRSARIFSDCVARAGLAATASRLTGVCISHAAALALTPLVLREIRVAERPNQASLLDSLG